MSHDKDYKENIGGSYISSAEEARRIMDLPRRYAIAIAALKYMELGRTTGAMIRRAQDTLKELGE